MIALGPAGSGKTWIAAAYAADLYRNGQISRIILTRPNAPCGRSLGFFPGSLDDKFAPWAAPVLDVLRERMGVAAFDIARKNGAIEMAPFEVMRGRSWRNAFVLLDEAQNATRRADEDVPDPHRREIARSSSTATPDQERHFKETSGLRGRARLGRPLRACRFR